MAFLDIITNNPRISIVLISLAVTFFISLVNYFILDKERIKEIKERQKSIQAQMKQHQKEGSHQKVLELNKELMSHSMDMMRHTIKPMIITLIPILILFGFIRSTFNQTEIASTWFWWYIISAILGSLLFRKILKLP